MTECVVVDVVFSCRYGGGGGDVVRMVASIIKKLALNDSLK